MYKDKRFIVLRVSLNKWLLKFQHNIIIYTAKSFWSLSARRRKRCFHFEFLHMYYTYVHIKQDRYNLHYFRSSAEDERD